jgi:hypothetical protein
VPAALWGGLRHRLVDDVVAVTSSIHAAATQTSATASGSHRREQLDRFMRGIAAIHRQRRVAAGGGAGGEWPEG